MVYLLPLSIYLRSKSLIYDHSIEVSVFDALKTHQLTTIIIAFPGALPSATGHPPDRHSRGMFTRLTNEH